MYNAKTSGLNFTSFEDYTESINRIKMIAINKNEWPLSTCTCRDWFKVYKHVILLAIQLIYVKYPTLNLDIEGKRKQGRPRLTKSALERQGDDNFTF